MKTWQQKYPELAIQVEAFKGVEGCCDVTLGFALKREEEIERLNGLLRSKKIVCPYCKSELKPETYKGYYDSFDYWNCKCYEGIPSPDKEVCEGGYA